MKKPYETPQAIGPYTPMQLEEKISKLDVLDLRPYQDDLLKELSGHEPQELSFESLSERLRNYRLILLGDYHSYIPDQEIMFKIIKSLSGLKGIFVECMSSDQAKSVNRFMGGISFDKLLSVINWNYTWGFPVEVIKKVFEYARDNHIAIIPMDAPDRNNKILHERDDYMAHIIASTLAQDSGGVFVTFTTGLLHLAKNHLPNKILRSLKVLGKAPIPLARVFSSQSILIEKSFDRHISPKTMQLDTDTFAVTASTTNSSGNEIFDPTATSISYLQHVQKMGWDEEELYPSLYEILAET